MFKAITYMFPSHCCDTHKTTSSLIIRWTQELCDTKVNQVTWSSGNAGSRTEDPLLQGHGPGKLLLPEGPE